MPHYGILGQTESGKTTVVKALFSSYRKMGRKTAVCDPVGGTWRKDEVDFYFRNVAEMRDFLENEIQDVTFCIDDSGRALKQDRDSSEWCFTVSRHWGHSCYAIAHRATQIEPDCRDQFSGLWVFTLSSDDGKELSRAWHANPLRESFKLKQGEFMYVEKYGDVRRGFLDRKTGKFLTTNFPRYLS